MRTGYLFGFKAWKRLWVDLEPFFDCDRIEYLSGGDASFALSRALKKGLNRGNGEIYIWGRRGFDEVERYGREHDIPVWRVEDGFIRSFGLGSDLTQPYSLVLDRRGIYFDPTQESDLEYLLKTHDFDEELLRRARRLRHYLIEKKLSKYNASPDRNIELSGMHNGQKVVMVPGQVEDDASIIYGANGMSNLELLRKARVNEPEAYIVYKPHPDVLAGNRKGHIPEEEADKYADAVITHASLDSVLERCDAVHTMTSLVGFEALMRGKEVTTYGMPFYAGWGLTRDMRRCERRERERSLDELVAATYLLYPRYLHPRTERRCDVEAVLEEIEREKRRYERDHFYRVRMNLRNFFLRTGQKVIRRFFGN